MVLRPSLCLIASGTEARCLAVPEKLFSRLVAVPFSYVTAFETRIRQVKNLHTEVTGFHMKILLFTRVCKLVKFSKENQILVVGCP